MNERETDIAEAERVVQLRTHEIEALKKSSMALAMSDQEDEYDGRLARQLAGLVKQCESVIEDEQREELSSLLHQISSSQQSQDHDMDTSYHQTDEGMEKLQLLLEVKRLKMQRQYLVKEVVAMQSEAGMGDRQKEYRRLIVGALGVRDEDVDAMVPEIVGELEEWGGMTGGEAVAV